MRKFAVVLLTLSILLTAVMPSAVFADPATPVFSITSAQGEAGDEVTVYLEMQNSPTIHSFLLQIHYDKNVLELVAAEEVVADGEDALELVMSLDPETNEPLPNEDEDGNLSFAVTYFGFWSLSDAQGISGSRTLAKLTFEIKDGATLGDTDISISYNADDVFVIVPPAYLEIENVYFATTSGSVSVICNHTYGEWTSSGENAHEKNCSKCGDTQTATHAWDAGVVTDEPTCVESGELTYTCDDCGHKKTEAIDATGEHSYGEWYETVPATEETTGEERRDCAHCDAYETREIPVLPAFLLGDIDGNEVVDLDDCLVLFQYSMFPDIYPVEYTGNMDYDHNGVIDLDDCLALFQYSMFPDIYPIS